MIEVVSTRSGNMEISHVPNSLTLIIRLRGFLKAGEFIKEQQLLHDAIRKRHIESILLDQQELKVLSQEVLTFLMHTADDFAKNGIRRMATLAPKDPFAQAGIAKVKSQAKVPTIDVRPFPSEVAALEWLRS
jgi:anti-anti-sigma regulatory factor